MLILKREILVCIRYDFVTSSTAEAVRHPHFHPPQFPFDRTYCQTLYHQCLPVKLLGQHQQPTLPQILTWLCSRNELAIVRNAARTTRCEPVAFYSSTMYRFRIHTPMVIYRDQVMHAFSSHFHILLILYLASIPSSSMTSCNTKASSYSNKLRRVAGMQRQSTKSEVSKILSNLMSSPNTSVPWRETRSATWDLMMTKWRT